MLTVIGKKSKKHGDNSTLQNYETFKDYSRHVGDAKDSFK